MPIRVAVISRNRLIRAGLVGLIAQLQDRAVVTEVSALDQELKPHDVAIYDLSADWIAAYTDLQRLMDQGVPVIGLIYDRRDTRPEAADATAHIITLAVTEAQLLEVLQRTTPYRASGSSTSLDKQLPSGLTEQEFRTLQLIGSGLSNQEVAAELFVSINTVKTYIRTAYKRIGAETRADAILWAVRHGLAGGHRAD